ncbi:tRNA threonylcarbamoyladenosine dehydratase [bacterium]|nr:tRNA threonylcarbamoyladenosine dehydratase [bacterium]
MRQELAERTHILVGDPGLERLRNAHVLVAGVGGVGGSCVEALGRAGVGTLTLIDMDVVASSNCNRQVVALTSSVGRSKVEVMAERLRDINPDIKLNLIQERISPSEAANFLPDDVDVVLDCIDALTSKVGLIKAAQDRGVFVVSSMGAGARVDPTRVKVTDLLETYGCPMATAMRKLCRKNGIAPGVRAVFSDEPALPHIEREWVPGAGPQKTVNGTISYMPGTFGFFVASEGIRYLLGDVIPPRTVIGAPPLRRKAKAR